MAISVQKYIKNMGKSIAYTTTDILSTKFEYVNDFKNENQEVFKEVYHSIKDYRTTFARVKKTITNNKIMDAARVGYDSVLYSITTGDFYAKAKETEVIEKYSGSFMEGMDIDDDDFDWDNQDLSTGDKVVATAIKKNSKIGTALTVEAIAQTGKAQMDVSKENTMLLYTQNERLLNKLDGGLNNIMGFLKQNSEETAKVQNKMNENLNKFMTNVDNNITKLTKQMDELLEMQRNMYKPIKPEEKRKTGYDDIIGRNGVINIKEYLKQVKKQSFDAINELSGNMLSTVLGDTMGEGSNLLANFAASPFRFIMEAGVNKALGKNFDKAASQLNATLEGMIPSIMAKLNATSKRSDAGIMGVLGKIFGIKDKSNESVNTSSYNKGPIPFDGITKRAITDVIPYYLRKMTSVLTGEKEMVYDFQTGRWTSMQAIKVAHENTINSANKGTEALITRAIEKGIGRSLSDSFENKKDYENISNAIKTFAVKLQSSGDLGSIRESDLSGYEQEILKALREVYKLSYEGNKDRRFIEVNGKRVESGRGRSEIGALATQLRQLKQSQNSAIKNINEGDSILRYIDAEGITGNSKDYHGKSFVNNYGDFDERKIQEMPMSQALLRAKDEYGFTLYQYLRDMGKSLRFIKANSTYLGSLGNGGNPNGNDNDRQKIISNILSGAGEEIDYGKSTDEKYLREYYERSQKREAKKEIDKWKEKVDAAIKKAAEKGKTYSLATTTDFRGDDGNIGLSGLMSSHDIDTVSEAREEYKRNEIKAKEERWKKIEGWLGKEETQKLREASEKFDGTKSLRENMDKVKDQGFSSNLMMFTKVIQSKINNPVDAASDAILKVDYWLQNLIYGENLTEDERRKSLFEKIRDKIDEGFKWIRDKLDDGFKWIREKTEPILKPITDKLLGTKNDDGIYEGGLLSPFLSGVQKGLRKNADDVKEYIRREKEEALRKLREQGLLKDDNDNNDNDSSSSSSNSGSSSRRSRLSYDPGRAQKLIEQNNIRRNKIISGTKALTESDNSIIHLDAVNKLAFIERYQNKQKEEAKRIQSGSHSSREEAKRSQSESYIPREEVRQKKIDDLTTKIENQENAIIKGKESLEKLNAQYDEAIRNGDYETANKIYYSKITVLEQQLQATENNLKANKKTLELYEKSKVKRRMFAGGVNRTGSPFKSVLSAGELHNGKIVPRTGIYNINPGDTVVNPAPPSVRSIQAQNERRYLVNIRRNADADDGLSQNQNNTQDVNRIAELMTNRDWKSLENDKERAEFLGSVAAKGLIGGGLGLLVGGPLLGAAVGAASSLTKSTDAFSSLIFGSAATDENGNIQVDSKGNVKRNDDGLISKEIMKAVPDIKRFGIGGAVAGLITPLGPLGGILAGSALGFAKNAEIFQGSLFGDGGIFSDKNINKLKKGAKNMGIGAAAAALLTPIGPFGLIGNALVGATAGYITSTDKFKDTLLGEKINPDDPKSKRQGGVIGAIKTELAPLKDFGLHLRDKIMDEIFGKDEGNGRQGGIFGAIKDNIVTPVIDGGKSIFHEFRNTVTDLTFELKRAYKDFRAKHAGNGILGGIINAADKITTTAVGGVGKVAKLATKPFRLLGDDGIGGALKARRIKNGKEYGLTARERIMFRGKHKMLADDDFSDSDNAIAKMNKEELTFAKSILDYNDDKDSLDKQRDNTYSVLGQQFRENISNAESKKLMKLMRAENYSAAERYVKTNTKFSDQTKFELLKLISNQKSKMTQIKDNYDKINESGKTAKELLKEKGIDIDIDDPKAAYYLKKQLDREIAHHETGLTDEEIEFDKQREFWSDDRSPLKPINDNVNAITELLKGIYENSKLSLEYTELNMEFEASLKEGNDSEAERIMNRMIEIENKRNGRTANSNGSNENNNNEESTNNESNKPKPKKPISKLDAAENLNEKASKVVNSIVNDGLNIFASIVMDELNDKDKIDIDITKWKSDNPDKELKGSIILSRRVIIEKFGKTFDFIVRYNYNTTTGDIKFCKKQEESFEQERDAFSEEYLRKLMPKEHRGLFKLLPSMTISDMVKNTVKLSAYLSLSAVCPIGFLTLTVGKAGLKIAKDRGLINKAKKAVKRVKNSALYHLGSHDIDMNSKAQKKREEKYEAEAKAELEKAITEGDPLLNEIALEKFYVDYDHLTEERKEMVHGEFIKRKKSEKRKKQILGHGLKGNIKKAAGTVLSGVKNKIDGGIDKAKQNIKAYKLQQQQQETFIGKFFDGLDSWRLKREKEKVEGKKDSRLAKILKWLFIGGIAAPILVGFVKNKIMPVVEEKFKPLLEKVGQKLVGVKDPQTGEYKGGLVSGIVNPIRNFFKDKFRNVHDWFTNEGKYSDENVGMKGLLKNLKGIGEYIIGLWKSGAATIYGEWIPKIAENIGEHAIPILGSLLKGVGKSIVKMLKGDGKEDTGTDFTSVTSGGGNNRINTTGTNVSLNTGFGSKIELNTPNTNTSIYNSKLSMSTSSSNGYINEDGTKTITNEKTGKNITSEKVNDKDMYHVGKNSKGVDIYIKNGTNTRYVKDEETGTYIPMTQYQQTMNDELSDNSELQHYADLEQDNALQANYSTGNDTDKVKSGLAKAGTRALFNYNNTRIINGNGAFNAAARSASRSITKATGHLPTAGGKIVHYGANALRVTGEGLSNATASLQYNTYRTGSLGTRVFATKIMQVAEKLKGKISGSISKLFNNPKVAKVVGKVVKGNVDDIAKGIEKGLIELIENFSDDIAVKASQFGAKSLAKAVPFISVVADFLLGMDNCRNILGIISEKPTFLERLCGGLLNMIPSLIMTFASTLAVASGGLAIAGSVVLYILSAIGIVIMSFEPMRNKMVEIIINILDAIPGINMDDLRNKREEAQEALAAHNEKNNTSISLEEYNNLIGNKTLATKTKDVLMDGLSNTFGYDSGSKKDILAGTENIEMNGKDVEKVRKKLSTIFSSIWEFHGEKDFNYSKAVDKDGNELSGKDKLNANKIKFNNVAISIVTDLIGLLNSQSKGIISDVAGNVTDFTGPIDASFHLNNVYRSGKKNPTTQFNIDEEHASWKRIKAIAGVCAIINEIFEPVGDKAQVTSIVVSKMIPAYFTSKESEVYEWSDQLANESLYTVDMSPYDSKSSNIQQPTSALDDTSASDVIATNANANDKLSAMSPNNITMDKILLAFSNMINKSVGQMTGDLSKVEEIFNGLNNKNKSINDSIDSLALLPTDKRYWDIATDNNSPFVSGLFKFVESMNRVVKAPFALAAASLGKGLHAVASSSGSSSSNTSGGSNSGSTSGSTNSSGNQGLLSKLANGAKKLISGAASAVKGWFGFGRGEEDEKSNTGFGNDPYHIYQRDFKGSYRTSGDTESQTIADSGCGPAAAASLLRMYGKKGDMRNAVNYALNNNYKEVNGGTYPQYFNDYLNKNGISTNSNADNNDVINNLVNNKPVILMGRDANNSGKTPYGSKYSHYVVARGIDSNGNVIVEDSEDKNGSTRYSLADTLRNSSVRITTGNGKYGRGGQSSVVGNYINGVNSVVTSTISNIVSNTARSIAGVTSGSRSNTNNASNNTQTPTATASTNGVEGSLTPSTDVKTKCGYTADQLKAAISAVNPGCSAEQFPEAAIAVENSKGVNALFTVSVAIQEHGWNGTVGVNTTGANWGNWNVFNISGSPNSSNGRWKDYNSLTDAFEGFGNLIMGNTYYAGGLTTPEKIGPVYCDGTWAAAICRVADTIVNHISGSGRGGDKSIPSTINKNFMSNVNKSISYFAVKTLSNMVGSNGTVGSVSNNQQNAGNLLSSGNVNIDADTTIICGDSITWGLGMRTSLGDRAMGVISGTTDINCVGSNGQTYATQFKAKSDVISNATDAIFFWGMNEVHISMSPDSYFERYQNSIDTILGYGGRSTSDTRIYILPVIWVPENSGYGGSFNAAKVEAFNEKYIKPFAQSKGYSFIDIYEDSKQVPHEAGNVHPADYQKLYEIIKAHTSSGSTTNNSDNTTDNNVSGSGRGRKENKANEIISKNNSSHKIYGRGRGYTINNEKSTSSPSSPSISKKSHKNPYTKIRKTYGRGVWGRDGSEETNTDNTSTTDQTTTDTTSNDANTTPEGTAATSTNGNSSNSSNATGLISLLGKYTKALTKGIFGNFYDAVYGVEQEQAVNNNNPGIAATGDAAKMLGYSLTMTDSYGTEKTMVINQDVVDLFNAITSIGFNAAVACGCIGNWVQECGGGTTNIRVTATKGVIRNNSGGLLQWKPASKHVNWSNENGYSNDVWCWESNIGHMQYELENMDSMACWNRNTSSSPSLSSEGFTECKSKAEFAALTDPEDAAVNYERALEGSGDWNGKNSEGVVYKDYMLRDRLRRLPARILYEIIVNGKGEKIDSGSGRGKKIIDDAINNSNNKFISKGNKYGRGIWGRADDDNTTDTSSSDASTSSSSDTSQENTNQDSNTTDSSNTSNSNGKNPQSKYLISKLTTYAKAGIKGVFGKFYDAVYGSDVQQEEASNGNMVAGTNTINQGTGVPYETYKNWKQGEYGTYPAPWASKNIAVGGSVSCASAGCALVSMALLLVHSGAVMESDFDPGKYIDDAVSRGVTNSGGAFREIGLLPNYKNTGAMTSVEYNKEYFGGSSSWDNIYNTLLNELNNGNYVMIRVTISGNGVHFVALDYIDTSAKEIYIMDPGSSTKNKLSDYGTGKTLGYATFKTSASNANQYVLNGIRSGSGRGKEDNANIHNIRNSNSSTNKKHNNIKSSINKRDEQNIIEKIETPTGEGTGMGRSLSGLISYDSLNNSTSKSSLSLNDLNNNPFLNLKSKGSNNSLYLSRNNNLDLSTLLSLVTTIADNSEYIETIITLLATIADNTKQTAEKKSTNNNNQNKNKNGLAALRNALDSNGSGMDIVNAVYQIAKS